MRALARTSYRLLLRIHPEWFRAAFGQEMLWIFDEQVQSSSQRAARVLLYAHLLLDALRSAFVQHTLRDPQMESSDVRCQTALTGQMLRLAEGGFIAFSCLLNVLSIVGVVAALMYSR